MEHVYDFYKPNLESEYAVVDGKLSIQCYLTALDKCYQLYSQRASTNDKTFTLDDGDFFIFHSPFTKLVIKSLARLKLNDFLRSPSPEATGCYAGLESVIGRSLESTVGDRDVEKLMLKNSNVECQAKTEPSLLLGREVGNMYTASLYGGLVSLLARSVNKLCSANFTTVSRPISYPLFSILPSHSVPFFTIIPYLSIVW